MDTALAIIIFALPWVTIMVWQGFKTLQALLATKKQLHELKMQNLEIAEKIIAEFLGKARKSHGSSWLKDDTEDIPRTEPE